MSDTALGVVPAIKRKTLGYPGPVVHIFAWTMVGLLAYGRHVLQCGLSGQVLSVSQLLMWMSCFTPAAVFGSLIFRYEKLFPLGGPRWFRNTAVLAAVGIVFAYVGSQIAGLIYFGVGFLLQGAAFPRLLWRVGLSEFAIQFFLFWLVAGAGCVFRYFLHLQSREREPTELLLEKSRLEASLKQAELESLRMRLNPHFLFNTLQNISVLTQQDPATASQMLTRLGDLLRTAIRSGSEQESDLATEIELTAAYAALEKMRFGDRLHIAFEVAPETSHATVPTLLLQPLLENAIKHGFRGMSREGVIAVQASRHDRQLVLLVTDNGVGPSEDELAKRGLGIGLGTTSQRLERLYPGENELTLCRAPQGGTQVRVVLPFKPSLLKVDRHHDRIGGQLGDQIALAHR